MSKCYCSICNFTESRQRRTWIFPWFAKEERMRRKTFRSRSGRGVKKIRVRPFSQRIWHVDYYSVHAHMARSQKFPKSEISLDTESEKNTLNPAGVESGIAPPFRFLNMKEW